MEASSSPLSLISPSLSPPLVTLYHFSSSSSSSCSFVFHFTFHPPLTLFSGALRMFPWQPSDPCLSDTYAAINNPAGWREHRPEPRTEKCHRIDGRQRKKMQNDKLGLGKEPEEAFIFCSNHRGVFHQNSAPWLWLLQRRLP